MKVIIDLTANQSDPVDLGVIEMVTVPFAFAAESVSNIHDQNAQKGDVLVFDGVNWIPGDTVEYTRMTKQIDESDAFIGDLLEYNGSKWVAGNGRIGLTTKSSNYTP